MTGSAPPRKPTFLQSERWKAVQEAKRVGVSIRGIVRELGIHRETIRRYIDAGSPPTRRSPATPTETPSNAIVVGAVSGSGRGGVPGRGGRGIGGILFGVGRSVPKCLPFKLSPQCILSFIHRLLVQCFVVPQIATPIYLVEPVQQSNPYASSAPSQRTCIAWPTGWRSARWRPWPWSPMEFTGYLSSGSWKSGGSG